MNNVISKCNGRGLQTSSPLHPYLHLTSNLFEPLPSQDSKSGSRENQTSINVPSGVNHLPLKLFDNQLFSYKEAAQYLRVSEVYLRKLKTRGKIPFVEVGRGIRFRVSSLNAWIAEREIK